MVALEGIVTKCSLVRPKVVQSVHYSEKKDRFLARKYRDQTMTASGATSLNVYPQEDEDKNPVCIPFSISQPSWFLIIRLSSSSLNTATLLTWTTNRFQFKKCRNEPRPDNCPAVLM